MQQYFDRKKHPLGAWVGIVLVTVALVLLPFVLAGIGTAWVRIALTPQGAIGNLDLKVISAWGTAPALLGPPVEKVVRASKFKTSCGGKTVAVAYVFGFSSEAAATPMPARKDSPHVMYIDSPPQSPTAATPGTPLK